MSEGIKGKSVVITGASSGIGEATALDLAAHGAKVMLGARREDRLKDLVKRISDAGGTADHRVCDVTNRDAVRALVLDAVGSFGQVDVLFNNAGLMPVSFLKNLHLDEWERMIDVNIKGVLWGIAAALPHMLERGKGHIINNASIAGHGMWPSYAVYSATKAAVLKISEGLRMETGDKVRVTVISPGITNTELTEHITDEEVLGKLKGRFNYVIESEDIARAVRFAIEQPWHVDVNELIVRATGQDR
jgi:NADP-dependent 3-hydroxy acid dehydrogenase YdfG